MSLATTEQNLARIAELSPAALNYLLGTLAATVEPDTWNAAVAMAEHTEPIHHAANHSKERDQMSTTDRVEVELASGVVIGALHGGLYVIADHPEPEDMVQLCELFAAIGWEPIPEDEDAPEVLPDGRVRIWLRRSTFDLIRALETEVDELRVQLERMRDVQPAGTVTISGKSAHPGSW